MKALNLKHRFAALVVTIWIYGANGYADFRCLSDVSYKWKKADAEAVFEVQISTIEAKGVDENAGKDALAKSIIREKARARDICHDTHENLAHCLSTKFELSSTILREVDFAARKTIQEAISADCKTSQGVCQEAVASEAKCSEIVAADAGAESGKPDSKDSKKDNKAPAKKK